MTKKRFVWRYGLLPSLLAVVVWGMDIDAGKDAIGFEKMAANWELVRDGSLQGWVRLRGADLKKLPETRDALQKMRARGLKTCIMLRGPEYNWKREYLPKDLRESYEQARKLGHAYGDLVDAWEVDNEPDLGFVPEAAERYTAFFKAHYLGLKAGARERVAAGNEALVIMGSLGLPPGPWLERFAANDGFSYTDGFTYHYYGYAEDFTGVYRQHEAAVTELSAKSGEQGAINDASPLPPRSMQRKALPIFLTEIGYGMLGKVTRETKEGRLRQWQWFKSVGAQVAALRIEAPMAFYLPPFFDGPSQSEFGLAVPPSGPMKLSDEDDSLSGQETEGWTAGGIRYVASDFQGPRLGSQVSASEPWMTTIGKQIGGNEATPALAWWMSARQGAAPNKDSLGAASDRGGLGIIRPAKSGASRSWTVTTPAPSSVVIDFLDGDGLSFIKRYNGSFVTGKSREQGAGSGEPVKTSPKPAQPDNKQPATNNPPLRTEEFIIHVRTQNGNLYEVYPTRQATANWQRYLEPQGNFTMSFYGRAELPWRFAGNKPASLVVVMYPKQLPATFEFRRPQLIKLGARSEEQGSNLRYGQGKVILYNFSDQAVTGTLTLPAEMVRVDSNTLGAGSEATATSALTLQPGERREIEVFVKVPSDRFQRFEVPVIFSPGNSTIPPARFVTSLLPDIAGMKATVVAALLQPRAEGGRLKAETRLTESSQTNREFIINRPRATEEASMTLVTDESKLVAFAQQGARVEQTDDGFAVTVTETPPGKQQRIEVEIPWPDGLDFGRDEFLSVEYRLRP